MLDKIIKLLCILPLVQAVVAKEITREDFQATEKYRSCVKSLVDSKARPKKVPDSEPVLKKMMEDRFLEDTYRNGFVDFADAQAYQSARAAGFMTHFYDNVSFPGEQDGQRGIFKQVNTHLGFVFVPLPKGSGEVVEIKEDVILEKDYSAEVLDSASLTKKYERFNLSDAMYKAKVEEQLEDVRLLDLRDSHTVVNFPIADWREPYETRVSPTFNCAAAPCGQSGAMLKLTKKPWVNAEIFDFDDLDSENGIKAKKVKNKVVAAKPEALSKAIAYALDDFAETYITQCTDTALITSSLNFLNKRQGFPEHYNRQRTRNLNRVSSKSDNCIEKLNICKNIEDSRVSKTVSAIISKIKQVEDNKKPSFHIGESRDSEEITILDGPRSPEDFLDSILFEEEITPQQGVAR